MKPKLTKEDLVYPDLSYKIVGVVFRVSNKLGGNCLEKHYQKAVSLELEKQGLKFQEQVEHVMYYDSQPVGRYYADFIIDDKIVLEIKKNKAFTPKNIEQVLGY